MWNTELMLDPRLCGSMCGLRTPLHWSWFMKPGATIEEARVDSLFNARVNLAVYAFSAVQGQVR